MWCSSARFSLRRLVTAWRRLLADQTPQAKACATCAAFAFIFLFGALPLRATTYYVAAAGNDSNVGTDTGHPWKTVAKVNGATFLPGDLILFNRGDAWYGTSLTVQS